MNQKLKDLFLNRTHIDRVISYREFKDAGISDLEYLKYCNLCEGIRGAIIIYYNNGFKHGYYSLISECGELLKRWLEQVIGEKYTGELPSAMLTVGNLSHYFWMPIDSIENDETILSYIFTDTDDMRLWMERLIGKYIIDGCEPSFDMGNTPEMRDVGLSTKEKRQSCEYYTTHGCIFHKMPCTADYCNDYEKQSGLPLKWTPTEMDEVDFLDIVELVTEDTKKGKLLITISAFVDQLDMKPVERTAFHKRIGDVFTAGTTKYRIASITKHAAETDFTKSKRKTCLLSERQKAEKKLNDLVNELDSIEVPQRPADLSDRHAVIAWARQAALLFERKDELQEKICALEEMLSD